MQTLFIRSNGSRWPLLWLGLLLLPACSADDPAVTDPDFGELTVNQVVEAAGGVPIVLPDSSAFASARFDSTAGDGDSLSCTAYSGSQRIRAPGLTILEVMPELHHAGAILRYTSLTGPNLLPVSAARAGGALRLSSPAGGEVTGEVAVMSGEAVDAWRRTALAELGEAAPTGWHVSVRAVHGNAHVALAAGVPAVAMPGWLSEHLALRDATSGRALIRLQRTHHTVTAPWPGSAGAAFGPQVKGPDVSGQMGPGNPPVWVEAVDHGELVLVLVEAAAPPAEVAAAALRTFTAAALNQEPAPGTLLEALPDLGVRAFGAGTDGESFAAAAATGLAALTALLQAAPAAAAELPPVSAELAALRSGATVNFAITANFTFALCEPYTAVFANVLWAFRAADAHTVRMTGDLDADGEGRFRYEGGAQLYGFDHVVHIPDLVGSGGNAVPEGRLPMLHQDLLNGRPAFELFELDMPVGVLSSRLRFDGTALIGRDYTLFAVMGLPSHVRLSIVTSSGVVQRRELNDMNYFVHGNGTSPRSALKIGFPDREHMLFSHTGTGNQLEFRHDRDWGWYVFAFRFGVGSGMTVFRDGEIIGHADRFSSLHGFNGATLAARWFGLEGFSLAAVQFAEVVAYAGAGSDAMVAAETERLRALYGL
jgi:hypothetical protein